MSSKSNNNKNKSSEEKLYFEALAIVDNLVDEVFERCYEVADENNFEKIWVLQRFREHFNIKYNNEKKGGEL